MKKNKPTRDEVLAKLREITEGMRAIAPERMAEAEAAVKRNMAAAIEHVPHLFVVKH